MTRKSINSRRKTQVNIRLPIDQSNPDLAMLGIETLTQNNSAITQQMICGIERGIIKVYISHTTPMCYSRLKQRILSLIRCQLLSALRSVI